MEREGEGRGMEERVLWYYPLFVCLWSGDLGDSVEREGEGASYQSSRRNDAWSLWC